MSERAGARREPRATYRLQLVPGRGFAYAAGLVEQLARLGVSHLYLSPSLEAVPGSQHGYDVTDPGVVRAELGGPDGLDALRDAAHAAGLGLVLDIVPNHVGLVSPWNPWWWDVLEHGPHGRYGRHLDIHWVPGPHGQPSLLLPELGATLEQELHGDALRLVNEPERVGAAPPGWRIRYHDHLWPIRPGSLGTVGLDADDVAATLATVEADRAVLARLLERQHYRLSIWTAANDHLDHRRFFAVPTLGGLRVDDPDVFADAHRQIVARVRDGTFDGLRIDHPDGLKDPVGYLERLRAEVGDDVWIVVEKILEHGERFRTSWPVQGTVGYEVTDVLLKVHVRPGAVDVLDELQTRCAGHRIDRAAEAIASQRYVLRSMFGTEMRRLTRLLVDALDGGTSSDVAREVVEELLVAWPTYRAYARPDIGTIGRDDLEVVALAVATATARRPELTEPLDETAALLCLRDQAAVGTPLRAAQDAFVWAFQQQTGPSIAKGFEDTALYRDVRFLAVNEVGSDPGHVEATIADLHGLHLQLQADRPTTMLLSSTHDTKRSADVRARLVLLSQDPAHWVRTVHRWRELTAAHRGPDGPSFAHEHLLYQTLVGAWPIERGRLVDHAIKAAREGAQETDHLAPNEAYEAALLRFVDGMLGDDDFVADLEHVVAELEVPGWLTSLSMVLVKLAAPGVPDIYQGDELWDRSLVDPDNRRPVDHERRGGLLAELEAGLGADAVLARLPEGLPKLHLIRCALGLRARDPEAFGSRATYRPLWAAGPRSDHVVAFVRTERCVGIAPIRVRELGATHDRWRWEGTTLDLPAGSWHDVLTDGEVEGGTHHVGDLLARFPVALLERA